MSQHEATETSPLLGKASAILPDAGDAPNGASPSTIQAGEHSNGQVKSAEHEESQSIEDIRPQYEGMPDVKKKLKYILPALSIGVSIIQEMILNGIDDF